MPALKGFRLVGGTSLALQIGHRLSVDLDFFSDEKKDIARISDELLQEDGMTLKSESSYALFLEYKNVKVDVLNYPYPFITAPLVEDGITLCHTDDIAAMKLKTIMNRGAKKNFYDIFFLLERYTLPDMIGKFAEKYKNIEPVALYKNLTYFEDAEMQDEIVPLRNRSLTWAQVKERLIDEARKLLL